MARTVVHLMRHGEVFNPEGVLYGRAPGYHLSQRGEAMAQQVADVLVAGGHDIRAVIHSPLERAEETATPTAHAFGVPLQADLRLIEAGNLLEGLPVNRSRAVLANPRYWWYYRNPFKPSWGESYREQAQRVTAVVRDVLGQVEGGEALLVSHQLPIWATRLFLEKRWLAHDPRKRQCALASLTSLTFEGRRLVGLSYWEPAAELVAQASDMVPGRSGAALNTGQSG